MLWSTLSSNYVDHLDDASNLWTHGEVLEWKWKIANNSLLRYLVDVDQNFIDSPVLHCHQVEEQSTQTLCSNIMSIRKTFTLSSLDNTSHGKWTILIRPLSNYLDDLNRQSHHWTTMQNHIRHERFSAEFWWSIFITWKKSSALAIW